MFECFVKKIPEGYVIHHKDLTTNNFLDNLQLMTKSEHNILHHKSKKHSEESKKLMSEKRKGKYLGEDHSQSILTDKDVIEIKIDLKERVLTQRQIAKKFGVVRQTISDIKRGKTWKNINIQPYRRIIHK